MSESIGVLREKLLDILQPVAKQHGDYLDIDSYRTCNIVKIHLCSAEKGIYGLSSLANEWMIDLLDGLTFEEALTAAQEKLATLD